MNWLQHLTGGPLLPAANAITAGGGVVSPTLATDPRFTGIRARAAEFVAAAVVKEQP